MKLFSILAILFLPSILFAKGSDYSLVIDKPFNNQLLNITQDYDRCLTAIGFVKKYKTQSTKPASYTNPFEYLKSVNDSTYGTHMQLIKTDDGANIILDKSNLLSGFSKAVSLVKTPSNGYYIGGHSMDGQLILLKLDSNAKTLFKKTFGTKNNDTLSNIIKLNDGGVLAIGSSTTSRSSHDPLFQTGLGLSDIFITRFTKNGHKLWSKKYGTQNDDVGIDAVEAQDGSIIIVSQELEADNKNMSLMRIDENGNKVWIKKYTDSNSVKPRKIIKLRDNNFLLSVSYLDELHKEQIKLIKFDILSNILYDKNVFTKYPSVLLDIKEFSDGGIVGAGFIKDRFNTDGLVMALDSRLNMLYQDHFGGANYDILNSITILNNSQIAVAGLFTNENSQESNMWILKLNRDATIAQVASTTHDIYEKIVQSFSDEISKNIIKIKKDLTVELLDKRLLFEVSQYELNKTQKIFLEKFSNKLVALLYKYKSQINSLEVNGHTSSEWGNVNFTKNYLNNEKLSMNRAYSTMSFIFNNQNDKLQKYLSKIFKGSGYGFSKKIMLDDLEFKAKSRRVSFKIILNKTKEKFSN